MDKARQEKQNTNLTKKQHGRSRAPDESVSQYAVTHSERLTRE